LKGAAKVSQHPATSGAGSAVQQGQHMRKAAPSFDDLPNTSYIRQPKVLEVVPFSGATLWRHCAAGKFPKPVKLSERVTCWKVGDVRAWLAAQTAMQTV
jgi:predicted DNA-binding transcriptional regulator AlpA